jgi:hypothetical protein
MAMSTPAMKIMAELYHAQQPPAAVMEIMAEQRKKK